MITITGICNTARVYADQLDSNAEGLLRALCASPISEGSKIRIMPDVHPGKGCAVGTTMTVTDKVAPGLVGVDIGCGMEVFQVSGKRLELQKLDKLVHEKIPSGRKIRSTPHRFAEQVDLENLRCVRHVQQEKARCSIGTLGGGNHFIEVDRGENGAYWLVIHSGSRHLGLEVASWYQNEAFRQCPEGTPYELAWASGELLEDYLHDMAIVQKFAVLNRQAIADEIIRGMKLDVVLRPQLHRPGRYDLAEGSRIRPGWREADYPDEHAGWLSALRRQGQRGLELLRSSRCRPSHEPGRGEAVLYPLPVQKGDAGHLYHLRQPGDTG